MREKYELICKGCGKKFYSVSKKSRSCGECEWDLCWNYEWVYQNYIEDCHSMLQIRKLSRVGDKKLYECFKQFKIQIRSQGELKRSSISVGDIFNRIIITRVFMQNHRTMACGECVCKIKNRNRIGPCTAKDIMRGRTKSCGCLQKEKAQLSGLKSRKHIIREDYFENIDSPEKAYWLGWAATDMSNDKNLYTGKMKGISMALRRRDKYILVALRDLLNPTKTIQIKDTIDRRTGALVSRCAFSSQKMSNDLVNRGIVHRKSLVLKYPDFPPEFNWAFLRGVFEGDGAVLPRKNGTVGVGIYSGSMEFLKTIKNVFQREAKIEPIISSPKNRCYNITIHKIEDVDRFYQYVYGTTIKVPILEAKYNKLKNARRNIYSFKQRSLICRTSSGTHQLLPLTLINAIVDSASIEICAKKLKITSPTVYTYIKKYLHIIDITTFRAAQQEFCSKEFLSNQKQVRGAKIREARLKNIPQQLNDKLWLSDQYVQRQLTITQIAMELGCSNTSAKSALKRHNIPIRTRSEQSQTSYTKFLKATFDKNILEQEYNENGLSIARIAKLKKISSKAVRNAFSLYNIPIHRTRDNLKGEKYNGYSLNKATITKRINL